MLTLSLQAFSENTNSHEIERKDSNCIECLQTFDHKVHADLVFDGSVAEFCKRDERAGGGLGALPLILSVTLQLSGATGQHTVLQFTFTRKRNSSLV